MRVARNWLTRATIGSTCQRVSRRTMRLHGTRARSRRRRIRQDERRDASHTRAPRSSAVAGAGVSHRTTRGARPDLGHRRVAVRPTRRRPVRPRRAARAAAGAVHVSTERAAARSARAAAARPGGRRTTTTRSKPRKRRARRATRAPRTERRRGDAPPTAPARAPPPRCPRPAARAHVRGRGPGRARRTAAGTTVTKRMRIYGPRRARPRHRGSPRCCRARRPTTPSSSA